MQDLSRKRFLQISRADYPVADFHNLGSNDRNAIMSLRIACYKFGSYTPQRGCQTNKFVIPKIFLENLIQGGFTVR